MMLLLTSRSRHKLNEARYFLGKLEETQGSEPAFSYVLAAFLSALRSVGLVLQSDLRGRFGDTFDVWWEAEKSRLPDTEVSFAVIRELRNLSVKQGEVLSGKRIVVKLKHESIDEIRLTLRTSGGRTVVAQKSYVFRPNNRFGITAAGPFDDAGLRSKVEADLLPELTQLILGLEEDPPDFDVSAVEYLLKSDADAVPFDRLLSGFREHLEAMATILDRADVRFTEENLPPSAA